MTNDLGKTCKNGIHMKTSVKKRNISKIHMTHDILYFYRHTQKMYLQNVKCHTLVLRAHSSYMHIQYEKQ